MPSSRRVLDTFLEAEEKYTGNANSHHAAGRAARAAIGETRQKTAELLGIKAEEIIYTSGATESNNLAIRGMAASMRHVGKHIISTGLEHSSVSASLSRLQAEGYEIDLCPMDRKGKIDLEEFEELIRKDTCLVSFSLVDPEVGIIQPVKEIAEILKKYPWVKLHIDASQAFGRIPVDFSIGDTISIAPHKFGGINGIGLLIKKEGVSMEPVLTGGLSTTAYRPGTPAVSLILSTLPAIEDALGNMQENEIRIRKLNNLFRQQIKDTENIRINSPESAVPEILNLGVIGIRGIRMQELLDQKGICVSVKSACASDLLPSKAVYTIYHDKKRSYESFRISFSALTAEEEVITAASVLKQIAESEYQ